MDYMPQSIGEKEKHELRQKLIARARQNDFHYLTVRTGDPKMPLQKSDWLELQRQFPELKLIFLQVGQSQEALFLTDSALSAQVEAFFEALGER